MKKHETKRILHTIYNVKSETSNIGRKFDQNIMELIYDDSLWPRLCCEQNWIHSGQNKI